MHTAATLFKSSSRNFWTSATTFKRWYEHDFRWSTQNNSIIHTNHLWMLLWHKFNTTTYFIALCFQCASYGNPLNCHPVDFTGAAFSYIRCGLRNLNWLSLKKLITYKKKLWELESNSRLPYYKADTVPLHHSNCRFFALQGRLLLSARTILTTT